MKKLSHIVLVIVIAVAASFALVELAAYVSYQNNVEQQSDIDLYNQITESTNDQSRVNQDFAVLEGGEVDIANRAIADGQVVNEDTAVVNTPDLQTMVVAGGCFWCVEADMEKAPGVQAVVSGYSGGTSENPTYKTYSNGGHREVVQVIYDASVISYEQLLYYFVKHIDPTDPNGSFVDRGVQYSPAIYYKTTAQQNIAAAVVADIESQNIYDKPLALPILPEVTFWPAEDYHQDFYKKSVVRYKTYRAYSGRDDFVYKHWDGKADVIPGYEA